MKHTRVVILGGAVAIGLVVVASLARASILDELPTDPCPNPQPMYAVYSVTNTSAFNCPLPSSGPAKDLPGAGCYESVITCTNLDPNTPALHIGVEFFDCTGARLNTFGLNEVICGLAPGQSGQWITTGGGVLPPARYFTGSMRVPLGSGGPPPGSARIVANTRLIECEAGLWTLQADTTNPNSGVVPITKDLKVFRRRQNGD